MKPEGAIAVVGLGFLLTGGALLAVSVLRGRRVCRRFAERLPEEYAELGSPRPGFFESARRRAYFQLVMRTRYVELRDPELVEAFAQIHRAEWRQLVSLAAGFAGLGLAFVWLYFWHGG